MIIAEQSTSADDLAEVRRVKRNQILNEIAWLYGDTLHGGPDHSLALAGFRAALILLDLPTAHRSRTPRKR